MGSACIGYRNDAAQVRLSAGGRDQIREFFCKEELIHFDETPCEKFSLENDLDAKS